MKLSRILAFLLVIALPASARAQVGVDVAPEFRLQLEVEAPLNPSEIFPVTLTESLSEGDVLTVALASPRPDEIYHLDLLPVAVLPVFQASGGRESSTVPFPAGAPPRTWTVPQTGMYGLALRNENRFTHTNVHLTVGIVHRLGADEQSRIRALLDPVIQPVQAMFAVPPFGITVRPCGTINAWYDPNNGNITVCTEIIGLTSGRRGALDGVLFHELGHKLINNWRLPNWDDEIAADNFAIWMLLQQEGGIGMTATFSEEFQNGDAWVEATNIIGSRGQDPHPLGIQRYQNIQSKLGAPEKFMEDWNRFAYPHMTTSWLQRIAVSRRNFESQDIARGELTRR